MASENSKKDWDFRNKTAPKLSEEFKQFFSTNIKGKNAIKSEGLTAVAHQKGMWKCEIEIIQFPNDQNNWTCICKAHIGGYDWDPIEQKIIRVEYTDIGDANVNNVTAMVKQSYIRMAATRAMARAMRKYTNIDMVSSDEINDVIEEEDITIDQLTAIKQGIKLKGMTPDVFADILIRSFGHTNYQALTETQGNRLLQIINTYVPQANNQQKPAQPVTQAQQQTQPATNQETTSQESDQPAFSAESLTDQDGEANPF